MYGQQSRFFFLKSLLVKKKKKPQSDIVYWRWTELGTVTQERLKNNSSV